MIAEKTGKNRATIRRNIAKLKEMNLLVRIGSDKKGRWKIINKRK
jgi:predicted HTH transcriptional regulator